MLLYVPSRVPSGAPERNVNMKKLAIAALMACVFGIGTASAVTMNWTDAAGTLTTTNPGYEDTLTVSPSTTFSMLVTLNVNSYTGGDRWNVLAANNADGTDGFRLRIENQWMLLKYKDGNTERDASNGTNGNLSSTLTSTNGTLRVAFSVTEDGIRVAINDNDTIYANTAAITFDELTNWTIGTHVPGVDLVQVDVYEGVAWTDEQLHAAAIPEPTALALLALGVAGVALRRRVA